MGWFLLVGGGGEEEKRGGREGRETGEGDREGDKEGDREGDKGDRTREGYKGWRQGGRLFNGRSSEKNNFTGRGPVTLEVIP